MNKDKVKLDSVEMTVEELQEKKNTLGADKRIVEVSEGVYETVTRLNGGLLDGEQRFPKQV